MGNDVTRDWFSIAGFVSYFSRGGRGCLAGKGTKMDVADRENLKKKIEADLELLIAKSWNSSVIRQLESVLTILRDISLESYDD